MSHKSEVVLDTKAPELDIQTGLARADRKQLAEHLNKVLASTYTLYAKTHVYHWNVAGPLFYSVHKLTDDQYHDLASAVDAIAERIRAIGFAARGGFDAFRDNGCVDDVKESVISARNMVDELASDHQKIAHQLREAVTEADKVGDVYTADLLTSRIGAHEEAAWMLEAILVR